MLPSRFPRPLRLGLYVLATVILLVLCLLPTQDLPDTGTGDRFELTITGYLLAPRRRLAIPAFALAYGALIEVLQGSLVTGRHGDVADFLADGVGVGLAVLLFLAVGWIRRR